MKKLLLALLLFPYLTHADTQTSGSLKLLQPTTGQSVDPNDASKRSWGDKFNKNFQIIDSTLTNVLGSISNIPVIVGYDEGVRQGDLTSINLVGAGVSLAVSGTTGTINVTASGGGGGGVATVAGSTQTLVLKVGSAMISTTSACGFPTACWTPGPSSVTIVGIWADAVSASTAGWTRVDILFSTGGVNGLPLGQNRLLPMSISTASALGLGGYSGFVASGSIVSPGEWIGVGITSMAVSGFVTQGINVHVDYWERGRY